MQLGKFNSDRDSALHYLCRAEWCNESFGDVSEYGLFIDRISNDYSDVQELNTEVSSVLEDWFTANPDVSPSDREFRYSLVGHFLVLEFQTGQVTVTEYKTEAELIAAFNTFRNIYDDWSAQFDMEDGTDND